MYFENLCEARIPCILVSEPRKYADDRERALVRLEDARKQTTTLKVEVQEMIRGKRTVEA